MKTMGAPESFEDDPSLGDAPVAEQVGHGGDYSTTLTWRGHVA